MERKVVSGMLLEWTAARCVTFSPVFEWPDWQGYYFPNKSGFSTLHGKAEKRNLFSHLWLFF